MKYNKNLLRQYICTLLNLNLAAKFEKKLQVFSRFEINVMIKANHMAINQRRCLNDYEIQRHNVGLHKNPIIENNLLTLICHFMEKKKHNVSQLINRFIVRHLFT